MESSQSQPRVIPNSYDPDYTPDERQYAGSRLSIHHPTQLQQYFHENLEQREEEEGEDELIQAADNFFSQRMRRRAYPSEDFRIHPELLQFAEPDPVSAAYIEYLRAREEMPQQSRSVSPSSPERCRAGSQKDFSLRPFTEVIPHFWRQELLEIPPESPLKQPVMYSIMQGFGSLSALLYTRLIRLCKESREENARIRDLRQVYGVTLQTMKALTKRRQAVCESGQGQIGDDLLLQDDRKYVELTYLGIILEYFNYHMSFSKRDITSAMKVRWLMNQLMPSFSEMKTALQDYYVHEDDLIAYKLVLELYERFYLDCENPLEHTTAIRDQLFPFARFFYRTYIPSMPVSSFSEDDATLEKPTAFSSLHHASTYFHSLYPRLLNLQSVEDYQVYYEQRACETENRIGSKRCQTGRHKVQKRDKYIM